MNGTIDENVIVKEYEFNKPPIQKIDSLTDNPIGDFHDKYFHTFDHILEYHPNFKNIGNNETVQFTIFDISMGFV